MRSPIAILAVLLTGCAALTAPSDAPPPTESTETEYALSLSAPEGRARGVALQIAAIGGVDDYRRLELYRLAEGADEAVLLQEIPIHDTVRQSLAGGVEVVDRSVQPDRVFRYRLVGIDGEGEVCGRSPEVEILWREPPPRPERVRAAAPFVDVVEVSWSGPADTGAVIFRRDVLDPDAQFVRVADLEFSGGRWVDRDVSAAGVWSYRVALARRVEGFVQYGAPSEEVYASTPEETP